jgi:hypothetical protein
MARGWESKSVESQQSESLFSDRKRLSAQERERESRREGLELSRSRVRRELESARNETHRSALENALRYLDDELSGLR